ncbi:cell division protein DivIC [Mobilisporobacter senegalensis]|uniref:Cell division protein DivIC n=1 Tax=Mobilisporobacter senegalensis TaxID=1329262 RepID=A0A3N1XG28_9FIRM|nr:septum formation initiator family protein [Mobilisporobacter senegalensis]ROR25669.1 cell division protein DivIC [Mobilisporobacter senegalensis]
MRKGKHKKRRTGIGLIVIVVLLICSIVSFKRFSLDSERKESNKRLSEVKAAIKEEQERTKEIEDYKAYVQTKKYIEEVAREKLGLVYEDEIIFKSED